jgi:hypothetical protein
MQSPVRSYSPAFWAFKATSPLKSFGFVNPQGLDARWFGTAGLDLLLAVNLLLAAMACWLMVQAARGAWASGRAERFVWLAVGSVLPLYLLAPGAAAGISEPGARILQMALAAGIVLALVSRSTEGSRFVVVGAGGATVLLAAGLFLFVRAGYGTVARDGRTVNLPKGHVFVNIPNDDQDSFYADLRRGKLDDPVFPTGMFLNQRPSVVAAAEGGPVSRPSSTATSRQVR